MIQERSSHDPAEFPNLSAAGSGDVASEKAPRRVGLKWRIYIVARVIMAVGCGLFSWIDRHPRELPIEFYHAAGAVMVLSLPFFVISPILDVRLMVMASKYNPKYRYILFLDIIIYVLIILVMFPTVQ